MSDSPYFHVAFTMDAGGLAGLGATLRSLLHHCSQPEVLRLHFFCSELSVADKEAIRRDLERTSFRGGYQFIDFDAASIFGELPAFFTNYASYGRLVIPELLPEVDELLYLDTDLLITTDVLALRQINITGYLLGAVKGGTVATTYDRPFFAANGFPDDLPYFNAGVLLLNLKEWRKRGIERKWRDIAFNNADQLLSYDQTVLNAVCSGRFLPLPSRFNVPFPAGDDVPEEQHGILHFVGAPKPWDFLGKHLHRGFAQWQEYHPRSWCRGRFSTLAGLNRAWQIRRSLLKHVWKQKRKQNPAEVSYRRRIL